MYKEEQHKQLIKTIKLHLPKLKEWREQVSGKYVEEDLIYRFYHYSYKTQWLQSYINSGVALISSIANGSKINQLYSQIIGESDGIFNKEWNKNWYRYVTPITTAYFHTKYFIEQMIFYGENLEEPPEILPPGWAAILHLFNLR